MDFGSTIPCKPSILTMITSQILHVLYQLQIGVQQYFYRPSHSPQIVRIKAQPAWQTQSILGTAHKNSCTGCSFKIIQDSCVSWERRKSQEITCRSENCHPPSFPMQGHRANNFIVCWDPHISLGYQKWHREQSQDWQRWPYKKPPLPHEYLHNRGQGSNIENLSLPFIFLEKTKTEEIPNQSKS